MDNNREFDQEFWDAAGRMISGEDKDVPASSDFSEIKKVWESAANYEYAEASDNDSQWNLLSARLHTQAAPVLQVTHRRAWIKWVAAAAIVAVAGVGAFYFSTNSTPAYTVETLEYHGKPGQNTPVHLPDGSEILLRGKSSVVLTADYGQKTRTVTLTGEAKFEIAKDAKHPFVVNASGTSTTVLGTGFDINAWNSQSIKIQVLHGKVAFASKANPTESLTLELGDGAVYSAQNQKISSCNNAGMTQWETGKIVFENTTLAEVARDFEATYDKKLQYPESAASRVFNGTLITSNSPDLFAEVLSTALKVKVSVK